MALIFDSFPDREAAERFAQTTTDAHGLLASVYDSQEESDKEDLFPFILTPPIVLVGRPDNDDYEREVEIEEEIEAAVRQYGGLFAGT